MSGGTDIVGIFVASAPTTPVYDGEISATASESRSRCGTTTASRLRLAPPARW